MPDTPAVTPTVAVVAIGRDTFDLDEAGRQVDRAWRTLRSAGLDVTGSRRLVTSVDAADDMLDIALLRRPDALVVLQSTFADASMIIRVHERFAGPLVCWSFPEERTGGALRLNSMCGANLAAYSLRRRASSAAFVHADPTACDTVDRVLAALDQARRPLALGSTHAAGDRAGGRELSAQDQSLDADVARVVDTLATATVGVVGRFPDGFEPCSFDPAVIADLTGARTDSLPLTDLFEAADEVDRVDLASIRRRSARELHLAPGVADQELDRSLRLYGGLRELADTRGWQAVATRCWPECARDYGGTVCAPQGMLTADGIPAMCEADVFGALTALILRTIAGADPFVTDVVDADRSDGTSAIWHCGQAPITLADPLVRRSGIRHPMQGKPLLQEFPLRPGRVTVARLSQAAGGPTMVIGAGVLLRRPRPFAGTCGVLRWDLPIDDVMRTIFDVGLEHHLAIVQGECRDVLVALAARWNIPVLRLGHDHGRRGPPVVLAAADVGP